MLENKIKESPFIDNIIVVGENQKFAAALIVPDFIHLKSWCAIKQIPYSTDEEMIAVPQVRQRILKVVDQFNKKFGSTEQIKKVELMNKEWTTNSGELTPTLKLKRAFIVSKYQSKIDKLFT